MELLAGDLCPEKAEPSSCAALASLLSLLAKIPAVVWSTDSECRFTTLAGAGLRELGVDGKDHVRTTIASLFSCSTLDEAALRAHQKALQGEHGTFHAEVNGHVLEAHVEPLRGSDQAIIGVIGVALDRTERLVADRALRLSEQSYRSLVEEAPYAICRVTMSGQLLQVNPAMLEMLGYDTSAELLERDLPLIFAAPADFDELRRALLEAGAFQGLESTWVRCNGQEIRVSVGGRAVRSQAGEVLYLDVIAQNVTERKQLEAQLRQAQKMQAIGQLAGGVAHDFNNLLTVIGGQVEVVLLGTVDVDVQFRLEEVKRAAERAATLTRQLLAFSRRQVLQNKVIDLNRVISHMSQMLTRLIGENIELTFVPGDEVGHVKADPNQIEQALMNLAVNARDAMPQGGRLTVGTSHVRIGAGPAQQPGAIEPGEYVLITVKDTGHGMDRHTQSRIFEPFFTTKKTGEGTGLGLSMVYGVVRQSGGHIQVESEPGRGSTFKIYLPCVGGSEPVQPAPVPVVSPRGNESILLVEDEEGVRDLMAMHLRSLGYRVLTAHDGAAAVDVIQSHPGTIDVLLSDIVMPRMGGRELAKELKRSVAHLKVVLISGYAGHAVAEKDLGFPDATFLPKPFSMHALAQTIREVLDGPRR